MTDFLVKRFIKNSDNITNRKVRADYGVLAGAVGIGLNICLFIIKFLIGIAVKSVSVTADAFNNLSDVAGSVISLIGAKLAGKPADEKHPFGHGRIEYLSALVVSFLILQVDFMLFKNSFSKIIAPESLSFSWVSFIILFISVLGKLWLSMFNEKLGKKIGSQVMLATAADAKSDMIATSATLVSLFAFYAFDINLDGWIGIIVSFFVLKAGIDIVKETLVSIIGEANDPELGKELSEYISSFENVLGVHDLIIHNYGPSNSFASIHVEVPSDMSLDDAHVLLDNIEKKVASKYKIMIVTHADPVDIKDNRVIELRKIIKEVVDSENDPKLSFHDVRIINASGGKLNVVFDLVIPWNYDNEKKNEIIANIRENIKKKNNMLNLVITLEHSYGS